MLWYLKLLNKLLILKLLKTNFRDQLENRKNFSINGMKWELMSQVCEGFPVRFLI